MLSRSLLKTKLVANYWPKMRIMVKKRKKIERKTIMIISLNLSFMPNNK